MGPRYSGPRAHAASFGAPRISRARPHSPSSKPIPSPPLTHYPWRRRRRRKMTRRRPSTQHSSTRGMYTHTLSLSFILFNLRLPHFAPPLDLYQDRPDVSAEVPVSVSSSGAPFPPLPSPATVSSPLPSVFRRRFALIGAGGGPPAGVDRLIRIVRALILDRGVFLGLCL